MIFQLINLESIFDNESKLNLLSEALESHKKGRHFIVISLHDLDLIFSKSDDFVLEKLGIEKCNILKILRSNAIECFSLLATSKFIKIDFSGEVETNIQDNIINYKDVNPDNCTENCFSSRSRLICENNKDAEIFLEFAVCLKNKEFVQFSMMNFNLGYSSGGGATTAEQLENSVLNDREISLCIMDSDREHETEVLIPDSSADKVNRKQIKLIEHHNFYFRVLILEERELENILSINILQYLVGHFCENNNIDQSEWDKVLDCYNNNEKIFKYMDFKRDKYTQEIIKKNHALLQERLENQRKIVEKMRKNLEHKTRQINDKNPKREKIQDSINEKQDELYKNELKYQTLQQLEKEYDIFWDSSLKSLPLEFLWHSSLSNKILEKFCEAMSDENHKERLTNLIYSSTTNWKTYAKEVMYFGLAAHRDSGIS